MREPAAASSLCCATCGHEFVEGDRFIVDTSSGFLGLPDEHGVDNIMAEIFGATDGKLRICEDCTQAGGSYLFETFYGDSDGVG